MKGRCGACGRLDEEEDFGSDYSVGVPWGSYMRLGGLKVI